MSPYIAGELRECYDNYELAPPEDGAGLNYVVCRILARFTEYHGLRYSTITEVRSAIHGAMAEFERIVAAPYEEIKREENGDVWGTLPDALMAL